MRAFGSTPHLSLPDDNPIPNPIPPTDCRSGCDAVSEGGSAFVPAGGSPRGPVAGPARSAAGPVADPWSPAAPRPRRPARRAPRLLRTLGSAAAEALWPTRCVGCDRPGTLLCPDCAAALPAIEQRLACPRCGAPFGSLVCTECTRCREPQDDCPVAAGEPDGRAALPAAPFDELDAVCCYGVDEWPLDRLVRAYKDGGERRAAELLGALVAQAACDAGLAGGGGKEPCAAPAGRRDCRDACCRDSRRPVLAPPGAVTFVPCTPRAFARRGFDHMERVARAAADGLGLPVADVLARCDVRDQRGLSREERARNVLGSLVVLEPLAGARLLVLDDVVTTGATLGAAARALRSAGASQVTAAAVVRAW